MKDLDYLFTKCKNAHYKGWIEDDLEDCKKRLQNLTHEELFMLRNSRWMDICSPIYPTLFALLHKEQLDSIVAQLESLSNDDLVKELKSTRSAFKKEKISELLNNRFDSMTDEEKKKVFKLLLKRGLRTEDDNAS